MQNKLFILMDDSGKLTLNENTTVFGGLFFYSDKEYMNFINKYKSIINSIKCKYCPLNTLEICNNKCPEIKGTSKISPSDRRRIFNLLKKEKSYGVLIDNKLIFKSILNNKASRGRYCDYAQKRIIKEIILHCIQNKIINPNTTVAIFIKIDQSKTKSNGYYNLKDGIYEELVKGIINFDYSIVRKPIIKGKLNLNVINYNSQTNYGIQSADMIANFIHRKFEQNKYNDLSFITIKLFLP